MLMPDLTVAVSQRRWSCVLDPALVLTTAFGLALVRQLSAWLDLWMVRAFWQVLDSSDYYRVNPRALTTEQDPDCVRRQLDAWERIRARTDLGGLHFFWVGDSHSESRLPVDADADLVVRYDLLCESLRRRPPPKVRLVRDPLDEQSAAALEVAALACALDPVIVLTYQAAAEGGTPRLCRDLAALGIDCEAIDGRSDVSLAMMERDYLRHLLVQAGTMPLVSAGLRLAVVHVLAPDAALARTAMDDMHGGAARADATGPPDVADGLDDLDAADLASADWWADARAFWYPVSGNAAAAVVRQHDA